MNFWGCRHEACAACALGGLAFYCVLSSTTSTPGGGRAHSATHAKGTALAGCQVANGWPPRFPSCWYPRHGTGSYPSRLTPARDATLIRRYRMSPRARGPSLGAFGVAPRFAVYTHPLPRCLAMGMPERGCPKWGCPEGGARKGMPEGGCPNGDAKDGCAPKEAPRESTRFLPQPISGHVRSACARAPPRHGTAPRPNALSLSGMPSGDAHPVLLWGCPLGMPMRALA